MLTPYNTSRAIRSPISFQKYSGETKEWDFFPGYMFDIQQSVDNKIIVHVVGEQSSENTQLLKFGGNVKIYTLTYTCPILHFVETTKRDDIPNLPGYEDLSSVDYDVFGSYVSTNGGRWRDGPIRHTDDLLYFMDEYMEAKTVENEGIQSVDSNYRMIWYKRLWGVEATPNHKIDNYVVTPRVLKGFVQKTNASVSHKTMTMSLTLSFIVGTNPLVGIFTDDE